MPIFLIQEPRCLFSHIPKTGGNSIRNVVFGGKYEGPWFGDQLPEEWQSLFKFAFVRNPFERVVSAWKMFSEGTQDDAWHLPEGGALHLTLTEVLQLGLDESAPFGHPRYNRVRPDPLIRLKNHILPQTHRYHGIQHVDFVGRFERLQADFDHVARQLGTEPLNLPKTNWTRHGHYGQYFDPQSRVLAERLYRRDLEQFEYQFENA